MFALKITPCTIALMACGLWRCVMHRHEHRRLTFSEVNTPVFFPRAAGDANYDYSIKEYFDLEPKDDLPPVAVITRLERLSSDQVRVRRVTSDNYDVKQVLVNDRPVHATGENYQEREIVLPIPQSDGLQLSATAEDQQGNKEITPHIVHYVPETISPDNRISGHHAHKH